MTEPVAVCSIPNCGRSAPPGEAFCSKHRTDRASPAQSVDGSEPKTPAVTGLEREGWDWLAKDRRLSLEWQGPVYADDDDQTEEWRVYRESGPINDREWDVVGAGATPLEAVQNAMLAARPEIER